MKINDFVLNIATVNGSGSQTANQILLKTLFRMGVPVGGKNIFPSNIQGLPTWFWIRANAQGFIGCREKADLVIAMNPQTERQDLLSLNPGGLYVMIGKASEELKSLRQDVTMIDLPLKELVDQGAVPGKIKKLVSNMIYVGVLAKLLNLDKGILEQALTDQFNGKATAIEPNKKVFEIGYQYASEQLSGLKLDFSAQKMSPPANKIIMDGNTAAALGLVHGGCSFVSWYPITPSTSLVEAFAKFADKYRKDDKGRKKFAVVQAEDELAAFTMVMGAGWTGARAMTATSGPGLSLMAEAAGYCYYAEVPTVIWDVQRLGPSTGLPTRTAQGDLLFSAHLSHGDKSHILLIPGTLQECFDFGQICFDLAEKFQQLVIVLSDLDLGMNLWMSDDFTLTKAPYDRGSILKSTQAEDYQTFQRYGESEAQDGLVTRTLPGNPNKGAAYFTRGSGHNIKAQYTENPKDYQQGMDRLTRKAKTAANQVPKPILEQGNGKNRVGLICYGSTAAVIEEFNFELQQKNHSVDILRIRALPFSPEVEHFLADHQEIFVIEQNRDGQMRRLLNEDFPQYAAKIKSILHYEGTPITSASVIHQLEPQLAKGH